MKRYVDKLIEERNLPPLASREEMIEVLCREEYGFLPPAPSEIHFTVEEDCIPKFCAGNAVANKVTVRCIVNGKSFSFPFVSVIPTKEGKHPFFIHINFRPEVPDRYMPSEELVDNGFAVLSFCYKDVTSDDDDFTDGLAGVLFENGKRGPCDAGKIAMWAWAAQRVMDYAQTLDCLDTGTSVVCGHSRLGKTALLCAATDTRFKFSYSNNSGCSGDALARGTTGETVEQIVKRFSFWFCENYKKYVNNESNMPFDQHWLAASISPRFVCVGSASEDWWADNTSQFLTCVAASSAFEKGFVCEDRLPEIDDTFFDGSIGYHKRAGLHYFSRKDWNRLIEFVRKHT